MKRSKWLAILMSLTITAALLPASVFAEEPAAEDSRPLLTIYYTNDVHSNIDGDLNYAAVAELKDQKEEAGENVMLVDAGDHAQGTAYGAIDHGETIIKLMNEAGYDAATLGNHEFDYGMQTALDNIEAADFTYLSCNFLQDRDLDGNWETVLEPYKLYEYDGVKIACIGITTPEAMTKSVRKNFQNEEGQYIYDFCGDKDGQKLYDTVQNAVDEARSDGADYVIGIAHLGDNLASVPWTSAEVVSATTGIDAVIDGHSHSTVPMEKVVNKEGKEVIISQTGTGYSWIGQLTIDQDGSVETQLLNKDSFETVPCDETVDALEKEWIESIRQELGKEVAETEIEFTIYYKNEDGTDGNRAIRSTETNLGDLNADAFFWSADQAGLNPDIAISNGGGIRSSIPAGKWTYNECKKVNTFGNVLCVAEVTGQQFLDALEFGARFTTGDPEHLWEGGGFLQTAGCTYRVDPSVENTVQVDDKNTWIGGPTGEYRVYDVMIYNKEAGEYQPLELEKTYRICGSNFSLYDGGDGFGMFKESKHVLDSIAEDYLSFGDYLSAFKDIDGNGLADITSESSPLASYSGYLINYENSAGAGRIAVESRSLFPDIEKDAYYARYANNLARKGIIKGIDGSFCASVEMDRAMVVTMLYRQAGEPETARSGSAVFSDVPVDSYFDKAVGWAYENGITMGAEETLFEPESEITREQYATFLNRYEEKLSDGSTITAIDGDPDASAAVDWKDASEYSQKALIWAVDAGILKGTEIDPMKLEPQTTLDRGMGVTMLGRYLELTREAKVS